MRKNLNPKELAEIVAARSTCHVKVGAVLADKHGIVSWGWNSAGFDGMGMHAEDHCLRRANRKRIGRATLYVWAKRSRSNGTVTAKPCEACQRLISHVKKVFYRDKTGVWVELRGTK